MYGIWLAVRLTVNMSYKVLEGFGDILRGPLALVTFNTRVSRMP